MFRSVYSINEKSGLVSIPVNQDEILNFNKDSAKIENIKKITSFFDTSKINYPEASELVMQAFDFQAKLKKPEIKIESKKEFALPKNAIREEFFPPCIKLLLKGIEVDGRKRALFALLNFFKQTGYNYKEIDDIILDWNKKNKNLLRENYVKAQIDWHKKQNKSILPPNCDNQAYYVAIGVCHPDNFCKLIKNPANYAVRKSKLKDSVKKQK